MGGMLDFVLGICRICSFSGGFYPYQSAMSDPDGSIKRYDRMLNKSLTRIFGKRALASSEIKNFFCSPEYVKDPKIKRILKKEPVISRQYPNGEFRELSLLWMAVLCSYQDSAELLVRSGADVNEPFGCHDPQALDEKCSILHLLLQMEFSPERERLIHLVTDHGANLQARDCKGRIPLHYAIQHDRVQMTTMFLARGADQVNVADYKGMTPLLLAAEGGKANELVPLLLKYGADTSARTRSHENSLHLLARQTENVDLAIKALVEKGVSLDDRYSAFTWSNQPIHVAAILGRNETLELFLDLGANVNALSGNNKFPLFFATNLYLGSLRIVETLLKRGANINQRTIDGDTALHSACQKAGQNEDTTKLIRLLLFAGADVLIENNKGETPFAILANKPEIDEQHPSIKLLVKELALKKVCLPSIELKDERIIESRPVLWNYYQDCHAIISRMKVARFIENCTFFELLAKTHDEIAALMRNPKFRSKFRRYDRSKFSIYAKDLLRAFKRAEYHYNSVLKQEDVINEAVYPFLPYVVMRKVAPYAFDCKKCESVW